MSDLRHKKSYGRRVSIVSADDGRVAHYT